MNTVVLHYSNGRSDKFQASPDATARVMADYAAADSNPYSFYVDVTWIEVIPATH
jgi:hypothetical protein